MLRDGVDELVPAGLIACSVCGEWLAERSGEAKNRRCAKCAKENAITIQTALVEFEVAGHVIKSRPSKTTRTKKRGYVPSTPDMVARHAARRRALALLARIHAPEFELLHAMEKAKLGLNPKVSPTTKIPAIQDALRADIAEAEAREMRAAQAGLLRAG